MTEVAPERDTAFPDEILSAIFGNLIGFSADLSNIAKCSVRFKNISIPYLYSQIEARDLVRKDLFPSDDAGTFVNTVTWAMTSKGSNERCLKNLRRCCNLRYLEIVLPECRTFYEFNTLLPSEEDFLGLPFLDTIRYLVLSRNPHHHDIRPVGVFLAAIKNLRGLDLSNMCLASVHLPQESRHLSPSFSNLTALTYQPCCPNSNSEGGHSEDEALAILLSASQETLKSLDLLLPIDAWSARWPFDRFSSSDANQQAFHFSKLTKLTILPIEITYAKSSSKIWSDFFSVLPELETLHFESDLIFDEPGVNEFFLGLAQSDAANKTLREIRLTCGGFESCEEHAYIQSDTFEPLLNRGLFPKLELFEMELGLGTVEDVESYFSGFGSIDSKVSKVARAKEMFLWDYAGLWQKRNEVNWHFRFCHNHNWSEIYGFRTENGQRLIEWMADAEKGDTGRIQDHESEAENMKADD